MRRAFVDRVARRDAITERSHAFEQGLAQLLEIHNAGLLARHNLVQVVKKLVLVRKPRLEINEAFFTHRGHLFG